MSVAKEEESPNYATRESLRYTEDYLSRRIEKLQRTIKVLVAVLVDKKLLGEKTAESFMESKGNDEMKNEKILKWYEAKAKKLWIAGAIKKKGALRAQLGIKEGETIPKSILQRIVNAETGTTISFKGKNIKVTTQLKRRAQLALRLGKMPKRGPK